MSMQRTPVLWTQMVAREGKRTFQTSNMSHRRDGRDNYYATWEVRGRGGKQRAQAMRLSKLKDENQSKDQSSVDRGR